LVFLVVSFPPIIYKRSSSPPFVLHGPPTSSSATWLFYSYLMKSTNNEAPNYAIFFIHRSPHSTSVQISSSAPCSQTPSVYVPPLMWDTKFHTHTEPSC
jgi:hypothetical protein